MKKKIGIISNSHNIGNTFFELSLIEDLKNIFGKVADIVPIEGREVFSELRFTGLKKNYLNLGIYQNLDYVVFSGPILQGAPLIRNFKSFFDHLSSNGSKFIFLSAGSINYSQKEISLMRDFLSNYKLLAFSSRDTNTFHNYQNLFDMSHNGICSAFYLSIHFHGIPFNGLSPYIIFNFEELEEPNIKLNENGLINPMTENQINASTHYSIIRFLNSSLKPKKHKLGKYKIIRTFHTIAPSLNKILINSPNKFVSSNPFSYLNLYKNAEFVLARRVHACVPALSYGKPAMLFNTSKRSKLFERVGLKEINKNLVYLDKNIIKDEHYSFLNFLNKLKQKEFS